MFAVQLLENLWLVTGKFVTSDIRDACLYKTREEANEALKHKRLVDDAKYENAVVVPMTTVTSLSEDHLRQELASCKATIAIAEKRIAQLEWTLHNERTRREIAVTNLQVCIFVTTIFALLFLFSLLGA